MTTNEKVLESGRKRVRTEEASCFRNSGSTPLLGNKNDEFPPKASVSDVLRAKKISTRLSVLLEEFPEMKFIIDVENLQESIEAAVVKYIEEKDAKKHKAELLLNYGQETVPLYSLPDEVLSKCLSFIGKGHYGSVALVSKKLNESYKKELGQETAYLEMATSVNLAKHCLNDLCKSLQEKDEILKAAAVNGNIDILRAAVKDGHDLFPLVAMKKKTECYRSYDYDSDEDEYYGYSGHDEGAEIFDIYYSDDNKWKYSCRQTVNLAKLVERGHLHVLQYLHEELGHILGLQRYWQPAIEYGNLEILQWLENIDWMDDVYMRIGFMDKYTLKTDLDYCECAIKSGNVEALKWLLEIGNYDINGDNSNVLVDAIRSKSKEMIQYCFDLGYNDLNSYDVEFAIKQTNSVEVFRKMNELGYDFGQMKRWHDSKNMVYFFDVIKFLRSISIPWDDGIMKHIVENGTVEMIQYAYEDGCPWTGEEFSQIFKINYLRSKNWSMDKFQYLIDNGCTFDYEQSSDFIPGLARKKELGLLDYFIGKNSKFDNDLFKEIVSWNGSWFEGMSYLLEKGKDVQNFKSIEEVFHTRPYIDGIKSFHRLGLPWCLDSSRNTHLLSKIACHNDLYDVKWTYENGCKGGNLVPYIKEEWKENGIRHFTRWKENRAFFEENGLLDETCLEKSGVKKLDPKNVLEIGDAEFGLSFVPRKDSFFQVNLSSLKKFIEHGYTFMSKSEQEIVCKEAYKQCCENSQNEDRRKRLALFVRMGVRDPNRTIAL